MLRLLGRVRFLWLALGLCALFAPVASLGQTYYDNETLYSNQDPNTETRRSDRFRLCFGHYNRDTGTPMTEELAQGNLQMYEHMWERWVTELGLHDINESATKPDGKKYRTNFNFLMTWNDGGGGGAYSSMDGNGFFYAMSNSGNCRFDPPSGATPHEMGHVWEGSAAGFNGTDSCGMWWECTANWMMLQFNNAYPQAGGLIWNSMYYPCHGRDYYDAFAIWEAAKDDPRYGVQWVNRIWTDFNADQQAHEYIIDRMIRCDTSGSPDKAGAVKDLWGDMAKKCVTWDYERQQWLKQANSADDGSDWYFYQRCRTPLVKMAGAPGWYRPERSHVPMEYGFNIIPLAASPNTTVTCDFEPQCDPVRQSDWRACLVAVSNNGDARYSCLWNKGANFMTLANDETKLYLAVIATPKPMKTGEWNAYLLDSGVQFPYALSFTNAAPKNVVYPKPGGSGKARVNPDGSVSGFVSSSATVDATAYVGPNAMVLDMAKVLGNARVEDYAVVRNNAQVKDNAVVSGHAVVQDNAKVYGNAKVRDWARVFGWVEIYENGRVIEHANCGDGGSTTHTKVYGCAAVKGTTYVYDTSTFAGSLIMEGDSANGNGADNVADHGVHFGWGWGADVPRFSGLPENNYIWAQHSFERENAAFVMDEYGINHGILMNGARVAKDTVAPARGGLVLPLNGVDQYVELHNTDNDFRNTAISVWAKWGGTKWNGETDDQKIWSMGDGASKIMYLTPKDSTTGKLRFVITNGTTTQSLNGAAAMPENTWTHVAVVFSGSTFNTTTKQWSATATLYVNGSSVASSAVSILPDQLNAPLMENANYLGRDNVGNYFYGYLDDFRVYSKALSSSEVSGVYSAAAPAVVNITADTMAPTPNAATWIVAPNAISDSAIAMSATQGTDASGWVEYYFACTSGNGHDSGWVSFNKYTDVGLEPGVSYTYTVKMRDKSGNTTAASEPIAVTTQTSSVATPSFAYGPVGITNGKITMTAAKVASPSGLVEYKFDCVVPGVGTIGSSGWQASPSWTHSGLNTGASYNYTVTIRDGRGNVSASSALKSTTAKDMDAPKMPIPVAHWTTQPYATIDNKLCMTAMDASDPSGVQYYFHCVSGGGPDSGWQNNPKWTSNVVPDGTYVYQYKVRDKSTQANETGYSTTSSTTVSPLRGYHSFSMSQLSGLPDDYLVSFTGTVMKVNDNNYVVRDLMSGASITVKPDSYGEATNPALSLKNVAVKGHMYTLSGQRIVTYANLTSLGDPAFYTISGRVTNTSGAAVANATVYFGDTANPSVTPFATVTTDANGNYSKGVPNGTWYVAVGAAAYNTSADRVIVMNGANIANVNFTLVANAKITGKVTKKSDGTPIQGAAVYFSKSPYASSSPTFTAVTDVNGNYSQAVQNGVWYVCAGADTYYTSVDKTVTLNGADVAGINFALKSSSRNIPRTADLLFSAVTDTLPSSGSTGDWDTYLPSGQKLTKIGDPKVEIIDGVKWVKSLRSETLPGANTGFTQARYASPLAVNGVTIVAAVKPVYANVGGESRGEIVDMFYDRMALSVSHNDGRIMVTRGYWADYGPAIPNGQKTILALVVQPDGSYKVFANGVQVMTGGANGTWTSIDPNHSATWNSDPDYTHYVTVGRSWPDGWSAFSGSIGDVFVYKVALTDTERQQLETDLTGKFLASTQDFTITASAGQGGIINPSGAVVVNPGGSQIFSIAPLAGYSIANVTVDGASQGAISTYTFTNVTANHTISATFVPQSESVASIAALKAKADGTAVTLTGTETVIYAPRNASNTRSTSFFYIGEKQAMGGLKVVDKTSDTLSLGDQVTNLLGYVRKPANGEVYLELINNVTGTGNTPILPVGMNNKSVLNDAKVLTNAVRVWGKVKSVNGTTSFTINDGYSGNVTVMVNGVALPTGFGTTKTAVVTGLVTRDTSGNVVVLAQAVRILP